MAITWPWIKPKAADTDALAEQHAGALAEHTAAQEAVTTAERAFEETGDDKSAKGLFAARERLTLGEAHLRRADKLLAERRETERQAELTRLRAEVAALRAKSVAALEEERPLIEREAELLCEVLMVRERRWRARMGANAWVRDVNHLLLQMGQKPEERLVDTKPSPEGVARRLGEMIQLAPTEPFSGVRDPRVSMFRNIVPSADAYTLDGWRGEPVYPLADLPPFAVRFEVRNL